MTINEISQKAWQCAKKRDAYGNDPETAIIDKLKEEVEELKNAFLKDRDCFPIGIKFFRAFVKSSPKISFINAFETIIKNSKGDELSDIIIVCLAAARELGIDIETHLELKLEYNEDRED